MIKQNIYRFCSILIAIMVIAISPIPVMAAKGAPEDGTDETYVSGYEPAHKELYHVQGNNNLKQSSSWSPYYIEDLPEEYDPRENSWFEKIRVKDQKSTGLCWAFAATTAAEISYAKELFETTGSLDGFTEASPGHLGYFLHHRVNDPLENTGGDYNVRKDWLNGGNFLKSLQHLATWSGVGSESQTPFQNILDQMTGSTIDESFSYDDKFAYDNCMTLEQCIYYSYDNSSDSDAYMDPQLLKSLIYRYGAAAVGIYMSPYYYQESEKACSYYCSSPITANHAVTVIGWDDNYSRDNFASYKWGETGPDAYTDKPEHDGAWIVQNSYGTDKHDNGYFYVSYESSGVLDDEVAVFDMQPADTYDYNYQYDGNAYYADTSWSGMPSTEEGDKAANVFCAKSPIVLSGIGMTQYNDGETVYDIDIYKGLKSATNPESGTHVESWYYDTYNAGYSTLRTYDDTLGMEPVFIDEGELFSVVVTFNDTTYMGVEKATYADEESIPEGAVNYYKAQIDPGQSFYRSKNGEGWVDMKDYGACFRIKAFADDAVKPEMKLAKTSYTYDGTVKKPKATVTLNAATLTEGDDYVIHYSPGCKNAGTYEATAILKGDYRGTCKASFKITKAANPLRTKGKTAIVKYGKLKKASQKLLRSKAIQYVKQGKGTITFTKASGNKKITIAKKTGKVTVKKGLKKGTYKVRVKVKAAGTSNYKPLTKTVTFKVRVK